MTMLDSTALIFGAIPHYISVVSAQFWYIDRQQVLSPAGLVWFSTVPHCTPPVSRVPSLVPVVQSLGRALHQFVVMEEAAGFWSSDFCLALTLQRSHRKPKKQAQEATFCLTSNPYSMYRAPSHITFAISFQISSP
jgi:hypothetical protein